MVTVSYNQLAVNRISYQKNRRQSFAIPDLLSIFGNVIITGVQ